MTNLCVFEDVQVAQFFPLTYLRPVFSLRAGTQSIVDSLSNIFPEHFLYLHCRAALKSITRQKYPETPVNNINTSLPCLFINGRIKPSGALRQIVTDLKPDTVLLSKGQIVLALLQGAALESLKTALDAGPLDATHWLASSVPGLVCRDCDLGLFDYPWQIISDSRHLIEEQAKRSPNQGAILGEIASTATLLGASEMSIGSDSVIQHGVVLDARKGAIVIGRHCQVEPLVYIEGPVALDDHVYIKSHAQIRSGSSLGPHCKVGGEISNTIMLGYSNKGHEGFVGDSYLGEWVNLGAGTTTSNLKNNYGSIRTVLNGSDLDTELQFLGSVIGDHSKTSIGTLLTAGSSIGIFCNLFGGGPSPKSLPCFSWGTADVEYEFEKAYTAATQMAARRQHSLTDEDRSVLMGIFEIFHAQRLRLKT